MERRPAHRQLNRKSEDMPDSVDKLLKSALPTRFSFGQILIEKRKGAGFVVSHRDDESLDQLQTYRDAGNAIEIAKYDDAGNYRPLKTAPNLRHGWRLELATVAELRGALDYFYPGRLAVLAAWKSSSLRTTALRETLNRQSGMYRVAAKISDPQINDVVAGFCRSNGGCLRTILWKRDQNGAIASTKLPKEKFHPGVGQILARPESSTPATVPLLCQEACNLLVAECRKVVKGGTAGL
jgi:sirohydrochlorin cobaltochelatase